jgi:hypothetical protein
MGGLVAAVGVKIGLEPAASDGIGTQVVALVSSYLLGQGIADMGKERAKVEAANGL